MRRAASFAAMARAAMLACNDHSGFAVIAHGPHCDDRADAVRGGAGAGAAIRHDRAAGDSGRARSAGRHDCETASCRQRCDITTRCHATRCYSACRAGG
jgi:hypothetical protein